MKKDEKKNEKEKKILDASYVLFIEKGVSNTSIQDIVSKAGVAKGTFYLYFKDKNDLQEKLITKLSSKLFNDSISELNKNFINNFEDQIIFIVNYIIDTLIKKPELISLISKDLSLGLYADSFTKIINNDEIGLFNIFEKKVSENNIKMENPKVILFMIIELASATSFSSIMYDRPLPILSFKPFLYDAIRKIL